MWRGLKDGNGEGQRDDLGDLEVNGSRAAVRSDANPSPRPRGSPDLMTSIAQGGDVPVQGALGHLELLGDLGNRGRPPMQEVQESVSAGRGVHDSMVLQNPDMICQQ
jgi:hypothetical protein